MYKLLVNFRSFFKYSKTPFSGNLHGRCTVHCSFNDEHTTVQK